MIEFNQFLSFWTTLDHFWTNFDSKFPIFRPAKFKLMEEHVIEFNQLAMTHAQGSDVMLNRVMTKGTTY